MIYCINDHLYYDQRHVCLKEEKKKVKQILFGKELEGKVIQASSPMVLTIVIKIRPERTRTNRLVQPETDEPDSGLVRLTLIGPLSKDRSRTTQID